MSVENKPPDDKARSRFVGVAPPAMKQSDPTFDRIPELPRTHIISESPATKVPRWKRILLQIFRGGSVLAGPATVVVAAPEMVQATILPAQPTESCGIVGESVRSAIESQFSETNATSVADSAIASQPATSEAHAQEFKALIAEAFQFIREQSTDMAKDIAKDFAKEALEIYVVLRVARAVIAKLKTKPENPIAKRMADLLEKLVALKSSEPPIPAKEAELAPATVAESAATLRLAGYEKRNGIWVPLGLQ